MFPNGNKSTISPNRYLFMPFRVGRNVTKLIDIYINQQGGAIRPLKINNRVKIF